MTTPPDDGTSVDGGRGSESAAPSGSDTPASPVFDAEILSDAENGYLVRRFAEASKVLALRPPAELAHGSGEVAHRSAVAIKRATAAAWRSGQAVHARSVLAYRVRKAPRDLVRLMWFALRGHAHWIHKEAYAKPTLKKYRPIAARNEDKKVFNGLL